MTLASIELLKDKQFMIQLFIAYPKDEPPELTALGYSNGHNIATMSMPYDYTRAHEMKDEVAMIVARCWDAMIAITRATAGQI